MAKKKDEKKKPLEQVLMEACNKLRSNMSGINYMYFVMGLVFLKFSYLKFEKRRKEIESSDDEMFKDDPDFYFSQNIFYIPEKSRWPYIRDRAKDPKIGYIIDDALEELEKTNKGLRHALATTLHNGKDESVSRYSKSSLPLSNFASLIEELDKLNEDDEHPMNDLIGDTYQYMLNAFAVKTADEKGEFYTPENIVDLITTLIEPYKGRVYDPCCGTGGMFVQSYRFIESHKGDVNNISIYGQESNPDTWRLAKMNLGVRGIAANLGGNNDDTFLNDIHKGEKFDFIIANPPFNLKNWRDKDELLQDVRWSGYGIPPVSNANYAWILHMLYHLSRDGVAGFLLANGALNDTDTIEIRKNLIRNGKIEAIIVLPREMFYYTDISVTLWIMNNNKGERIVIQDEKEVVVRDRTHEVLFMDLRTFGSKNKDGYVELSREEMNSVKHTLNTWQSLTYKKDYKDIPEYSASIKTERKYLTEEEIKSGKKTIEDESWSLVPSKYIEFVDHDLDIDFDKEMKRIQGEMSKLLQEEKESQNRLSNAFKGIGYEI